MCTHTWQTVGQCDQQALGLLFYEVGRRFMGEGRGIHVVIGCEAHLNHLNYHRHHGGAAILAAWSLKSTSTEDAAQELRQDRTKFEEMATSIASGPKAEKGIADAMAAYDALIEQLEKA